MKEKTVLTIVLLTEEILCLTSLWVACQLCLRPDWLPGQRPQLSSHPPQSRSQCRRRHHRQDGFQYSAGGSVEADRGLARQHGHSHCQGEQNGDGGVNGHYLAKLSERHNNTEEKRNCGDHCGDGAGHYGNTDMVHCLHCPPLPHGRRLLQIKHKSMEQLYFLAFRVTSPLNTSNISLF